VSISSQFEEVALTDSANEFQRKSFDAEVRQFIPNPSDDVNDLEVVCPEIEMNSNTRVKCTIENHRGTQVIASSRKLWHKYGEKVIVFTRHQEGCSCAECQFLLLKDAESGTVSRTRKFRRAYLKCFQKGCPAKMIVNTDMASGEDLPPVTIREHTHQFVVISEVDSMEDMMKSVEKKQILAAHS